MRRSTLPVLAWAILAAVPFQVAGAPAGSPGPKQFTPLLPAQARIVAATVAYPGGRYEAANLVDGAPRTEYSSAGKGLQTQIDFDFGRPQPIGGFRHLDRADPATVARARLTFSDQPDFQKVLGTVDVAHANTRSGRTTHAFQPVTARYARWQVTGLGPKRYGTVGGAEIGFFTAAPPEAAPTRVRVHSATVPALVKARGGPIQVLKVRIDYPYAEPVGTTVHIQGEEPMELRVGLGGRTVDLPVGAVDRQTALDVKLDVAGHTVSEKVVLKPVRHWELWLLAHSHNDIGYTHVQTEVERKQWQYLDEAVALARRTADYPPEARFKWNVEVMWAVDSYLKQATPEQRREFVEAVRRGSIGLDALYGNELTALCRPEELFRLVDCARRVSGQYDLKVDSAMISDVPGYTWGIVPALAQTGVRYFSIGPNHCHRIGYTLADWGDRPFWWVSPSGEERVLCWMAGKAYSWFHNGRLGSVENVRPESLLEYLNELEAGDYPYDMVQVRYSIGGDNGPPDPDLPEFVKHWNEQYAWPKLVIATTGELMREFDRRYGAKLPEVRGDFTPYWEDGAGSSARETAMTRSAAERLVQAEALWAMLDPKGYPDADFYAAWRNAILYNEHTWGAHCSISQPDSEFTLSQWKIKQQFATDADAQSRKLLSAALARRRGGGKKDENVAAIDVYNTCSWPRTDLVVLPLEMKLPGDAVKAPDGRAVPSQRLATGQLAFLARDVPPLGAGRFLLGPGAAHAAGSATAEGPTLANQAVRVAVDPKTGAIAELRRSGAEVNLAARPGGPGLNHYCYVAGRDPKGPQPAGPAKITVADRGPLVASLVVESDAPGCRRLVRRLRVIDGAERVDLVNVVDKEQVRTPESVHFGFAPNVPGGVMRMDIPWAVIRPGEDQLPGACKNYFTVGRWVDVSGNAFGLTCATVDAPLVEVGAISVDVPHPVGTTEGWICHLEPTQTFYSYVMNNYWETNYKASQQGPTPFRYSLRPHGPYDAAAAARFGIERSRPLVVAPADPQKPVRASVLQVEPAEVIVTLLAPSTDGRALMLRLFNVGEKPAAATVTWNDPMPKRVTLSSPFQKPGEPLSGPIEMPAKGIVTLRGELGE